MIIIDHIIYMYVHHITYMYFMYKLGSGRAPLSNGSVSYGYDWFFINMIHANSWWSTSFTSFVRICLSHQDYSVSFIFLWHMFFICFHPAKNLNSPNSIRVWWLVMISGEETELKVSAIVCGKSTVHGWGLFAGATNSWSFFREKSGRTTKKTCSRLPENSCRIDACRLFKVHFLPNLYFQHTSVHKSMHNQIWTFMTFDAQCFFFMVKIIYALHDYYYFQPFLILNILKPYYIFHVLLCKRFFFTVKTKLARTRFRARWASPWITGTTNWRTARVH